MIVAGRASMKRKSRRIRSLTGMLTVALLMQIVTTGYTAPSDIEEQNRRSRQEAQDRQQREQQKDVFLQKGAKATEDLSLPDETPSFVIHTLELSGDSVKLFPWLQKMLNQYQGRKIGIEGINLIVKRLTNALIDRGYITSRVLIPQQNLSGGTLKLVLIPGKISDIRLAEGSVHRDWRNAFPARPGNILNLRNLEQGLEQMKRVPSQDVDMQLVPGKNAGESDVVISVKESNPYKLVLSVDNSGTKETGKLQLSTTLGVDNLFGHNDLFNYTKNGDGDRAGSLRGTDGDSLYFSIPYQNSTFSFTSSRYNYRQTIVTSTQPFLFSGHNNSMDFHLTQLLARDQSSKTSLEAGITKGHIRSFLEDAEIETQRQDTTAFKLGLSHRHYFGQTTLDIEIDNKRGVPWFGAQADSATAGQPTLRYNMWLIDTSLTTPVNIGKTQGRYSLAFHGQYTRDVLYATDFISIGNRYTVRGFDGEQTLAAEKGWYVRNELSLPTPITGMEAYTGLDYGAISGPSAQYLDGRILAGAVLGLRGSVKNVQYDVFLGKPLRKPDSLTTAKHTFGFQVICQI